ncbi:MAG: hypothetical protein EOM37_08675 [Proteobacteria bacterium]|nr:hypothetical protein [Pseudomonadota bacterium]
MHTEFMAFINDDETLRIVRGWAEKQGFPADSVREGGSTLFLNLLESEPAPKIALIDFDGQEEPTRIASRIVSLSGPASRIIAIGSANDVTLYRNMIGAGLNDYLVKPLSTELLTQTMLAASRGESGPGAIKDAKNIVFIGVRGGVGASSIAVNTAWMIAHQLKEKCALLDLDLQFGSSALSLDIEPGHGLRDVVSSPQRVDGLMIAGAMINEHDNFAVLGAEEALDESIHVDTTAIAALLKEMRTNYRAVLIDLPRHLIPSQKRLLATAHEIVLVTEMSLIGIRDVLRIRTVIKGLGSSARITHIATKIGANRPPAVDDTTFAKGAQAKIDFVIPDDHKTMVLASNSGKMLGSIAPSAPISKAHLDLAKYLLGPEHGTQETAKTQGGLLSSLFTTKPKQEKQGK